MKSVHFGFGADIGAGETPSVGLNRRGNVVLVHEAPNGQRRYRVGRVSQATIRWEESKPAGAGVTPRVALNNHGTAVEVHRNPAHKKLYCRVGRLNARGDEVAWPDARGYAEGANHTLPAIAINDAGIVVEEHEVHQGSKVWLYYDVGEVKPAGTELYVDWTGKPVRGAEAAMPAVAINNRGVVVEVHRYPYGTSDRRLFYTIGRLDGRAIAFEPRKVIEMPNGTKVNGFYPSVALTDEGLVIVVLRARTKVEVLELVGQVAANGKSIAWHRWWYFDDGTRPSVAAAGKMAVEVHQHEKHKDLRFSTSVITDRARWMQDRLETLGRKHLDQLVLPASHDAGMYWVYGHDLGMAKNQNLRIYDQLRYGIRYFDLRVQWNDGLEDPVLRGFTIHHGGWRGPDLKEVLDDIKRFANEKHQELIILTFSTFRNINAGTYRMLVDQIDQAIGRWLVKTKPDNERLAEITLGEYVKNGPAILLVVDGNFAIAHRKDGFWVYRDFHKPDPVPGHLRVHDVYAGEDTVKDMQKDQFGKFARYDGKMQHAPHPRCDLFLLSWTLTPKGLTTPRMLARRANPWLAQAIHLGHGNPPMPPPGIPNGSGKIMNMLFVDYVESARVTDVALFLNGEVASEAEEAAPPRRTKAAARRAKPTSRKAKTTRRRAKAPSRRAK